MSSTFLAPAVSSLRLILSDNTWKNNLSELNTKVKYELMDLVIISIGMSKIEEIFRYEGFV